jgi:hypothetical protein
LAATADALNDMFENPNMLIKNGVKLVETEALEQILAELGHEDNGYVARTT